MPMEIVVPKLDKRFNSAVLVKWYKKPGEYVGIGELLVEVETSKASIEIAAEVPGVFLKALKNEGDIVEGSAIIGYVGTEGEAV